MRKFIDLSHEYTDAMPVYPGDPAVTLTPIAEIAADGYADHRICAGMHVGTHIDAPAHMIAEGASLNDFPLSRFQGVGVVVDARGQQVLTEDLLQELDIHPGNVVLIWTDWSKHYRTDQYYQDWPYMTAEFANALTAKGVSIVGMDTPSPDEIDSSTIHNIFFEKDILLLENLTDISALRGYKLFRVHAYPIKYAADSAPVRVVVEAG